ncbi:MAG TPA: hypothetical protein DCZ20_09700 [Lachnospiraceae bacterium]|nr:hypothetical protein [Lachnospiraceae bacterium]
MSRGEFMRQLEMLLQDISPEERQEALQYYRDYLDEAGEEQEAQVLSELGSPEKVAATIQAGLRGQDEESGEYRETGYADTRFEEKDSPQIRGCQRRQRSTYKGSYTYDEKRTYDGSTGYHPDYQKNSKKGSAVPKILLILAIIFIGLPILLPLGAAVLIIIFALLLGFAALVLGLAVGCVAVAVSGVVLFICGLVKLTASLPVGFMLMGGGLILGVLGVIGTVVFVKVCMLVVPAVIRWVVDLLRRPFHRRAVQ